MALTKVQNRMIGDAPTNVLDYIPTSEHAGIAAGTSTYDCTTAIKDALATGKHVIMPDGVYLVSGVIRYDNGGWVLEGQSPAGGYKANAGKGGAIIKATAAFADTHVLHLRSNTGQPCQVKNIIVDALDNTQSCINIDGDVATHESISNVLEDVVCLNGSIGVSFGDKNYVNNIYRVNCRSCTTGFSFPDVDNNALNIIDCVISDATTGFDIDAGTQINIKGGTFEDIATLFKIDHTAGTSVSNVIHVRDCYIEDITAQIFDDNSSVGVFFTFQNNQVVINESISGTYVFEFGSPHFLDIRDNQFKGGGSTTSGQYMFRLNNASLSGQIQNNLFGMSGSINRFLVSIAPASAGFFYDNTNASRAQYSAINQFGNIKFQTGHIAFDATNEVKILVGTATPEGAVTGGVGSLFLRTDGGAGTVLYVKESGTGNTGWVAK